MQPLFSFEAIGTRWQIDTAAKIPSEKQQYIRQQLLNRIEVFDKTYSRFRKDSLVTKMSERQGTYHLPPDAQLLLHIYKTLYTVTNHAFTPLIGNVLVQAGYDMTYSLQPKQITPPDSWEECIDYEYPYIRIRKPTLLDFGAGGKGYLIDILCKIFEKNNINSFTIDAGGDILYKTGTNKPLRVGLEHPDNFSQVIGVAQIRNQSICCSAGNRRKWKNFHHIINPFTLRATKEILSTWVVAETALVADAIATCLFFVPAKKLLDFYTFSYALIHDDYSLESSRDFPAEFFTTNTPMTAAAR